MTRSPSVIHFRCLDTMGLRDVARAIGAGQAGVRLTSSGLAVYRRGMRREPPALPPPVDPALTAPAALSADWNGAPLDAAVDSLLEIPPPPPAAAPPASGPEGEIVLEVGVRRPTALAAALVVLGIACGALVAHAVTAGLPVAVTAVAQAADAPTAPVAWPRAVRVESASRGPITLETTVVASPLPPLSADLPPDPAHASIAPTRAQLSSSHHHHHAHTRVAAADSPAPTGEAPPQESATPTPAAGAQAAEDAPDSVDDSATMAQAREALTDAL